MAIMTYARGSWKINAPFTVNTEIIYTCVAVRSFRELEAEGVSVFDRVYRPASLTEEKYELDRVNAINIIVLETDGVSNLYVPSSFIVEYPVAVSEGFSRVVLALDIGILSDKIPLEHLTETLRQTAQDITGQENAKVELFLAPHTGVITPEQAEMMEANRQALLKTGSNQYAENKRLTDELILERAKTARLEQIIIDNAIPTP